jgi:hypothetical protein
MLCWVMSDMAQGREIQGREHRLAAPCQENFAGDWSPPVCDASCGCGRLSRRRIVAGEMARRNSEGLTPADAHDAKSATFRSNARVSGGDHCSVVRTFRTLSGSGLLATRYSLFLPGQANVKRRVRGDWRI